MISPRFARSSPRSDPDSAVLPAISHPRDEHNIYRVEFREESTAERTPGMRWKVADIQSNGFGETRLLILKEGSGQLLERSLCAQGSLLCLKIMLCEEGKKQTLDAGVQA